jgi:hypothetical protein
MTPGGQYYWPALKEDSSAQDDTGGCFSRPIGHHIPRLPRGRIGIGILVVWRGRSSFEHSSPPYQVTCGPSRCVELRWRKVVGGAGLLTHPSGLRRCCTRNVPQQQGAGRNSIQRACRGSQRTGAVPGLHGRALDRALPLTFHIPRRRWYPLGERAWAGPCACCVCGRVATGGGDTPRLGSRCGCEARGPANATRCVLKGKVSASASVASLGPRRGEGALRLSIKKRTWACGRAARHDRWKELRRKEKAQPIQARPARISSARESSARRSVCWCVVVQVGGAADSETAPGWASRTMALFVSARYLRWGCPFSLELDTPSFGHRGLGGPG